MPHAACSAGRFIGTQVTQGTASSHFTCGMNSILYVG